MSAPTGLGTAPTAARLTKSDRTRIVTNEIAKGLRLRWTYRATVVPEMFGALAMYLMFQYFLADGRILDELVAETAPGMFAFVVGYGTLLRLVAGILEERNAGTLEQTHLSPLSIWQLGLGRLATVMTETVPLGTFVTVVVLVALGIDYPFDAAALVPVGLMLAGIAGFALLVAAASFTYPGIGALVHVLQMMVMSVNGMLAPVELFPQWLELIAKFVPTTLAVSATRRILTDGDSLADLTRDGSLGWLILHTAVVVAAGWIAYEWQIRRALRDGRMGPA